MIDVRQGWAGKQTDPLAMALMNGARGGWGGSPAPNGPRPSQPMPRPFGGGYGAGYGPQSFGQGGMGMQRPAFPPQLDQWRRQGMQQGSPAQNGLFGLQG